jgi:Transposase DDE domain
LDRWGRLFERPATVSSANLIALFQRDYHVWVGIRTIDFKIEKVSQRLSEQISKALSEDTISRIAMESGFVKRTTTNKLRPSDFIDVLIASHSSGKQLSLNAIAFVLATRHGVEISKQGLDARFNTLGVLFLRGVLEQVLKDMLRNVDNDISFLSAFKSVRIKDSTSFQLPSELAHLYPGSGGAGSKASVRIQFEFDFKTGRVYDLTFGPFNVSDQTDATRTINNVEPDDLVIRDLGYINHDAIIGIEKVKAWYLNRLRSRDNVYEKSGQGEFELIDFGKLYRDLVHFNTNQTEREVFITDRKDIKARMIIEVVPEDVYEKRIRKAMAEAKKKGRQLSNEYRDRARLNLFITNVPKDVLKTEDTRTLYRLRWQVELIFKAWKQTMKIEKVKKMKAERFECMLLSKLIWLTMNWAIIWELTKHTWENEGYMLSLQKSFACLGEMRSTLMMAVFRLTKIELKQIITNIFSQREKLRLEEKKGSLSLQKLILTFN